MTEDFYKPVCKLSAYTLPRDCRPSEITFIKKVSNYLVIFYRGNYGDIYDISSGLEGQSPLFDLSQYYNNYGVMVDVFLYNDEEENRELLIGYCDNNKNHIVVYDLTGDEDNKYTRGLQRSLFVGDFSRLIQNTNGEIILIKRESSPEEEFFQMEDGEILSIMGSNEVGMLLKGIHWSVAKIQYKNRREILLNSECITDYDDPNYRYGIIHNSEPHREAHEELYELFRLNEDSMNNEQKKDLFTMNLETGKKFLQLIWSYYNDGKGIIYCGHGIWLTEWKYSC